MRKIVIPCFLLGVFLLASCSTAIEAPLGTESIVIAYVEEYHKPVTSPYAELLIEGSEETLKFKLKSPAATATIEGSEIIQAAGWSTAKKMNISGPDKFEFSAPPGRISLLPYKIMIINSTQIEVRPLTDLDMEFARGQFAKSEALSGLNIEFPKGLEE